MKRTWTQILLQAALVVLVATVAAVSVNAARSEGIPLVKTDSASSTPGIREIHLDEAKQLFDEGKAVFLDSRSPNVFRRGHIKNARNLPFNLYDDLFEKTLGGVSPDTPIVIYCSGVECHTSDAVASLLKEDGYKNLNVFFGGWPAWVESGFPVKRLELLESMINP